MPSEYQIPESVCFAIELARACLPRVTTLRRSDLTGRWLYFDVKNEDEHGRQVILDICIKDVGNGPAVLVTADCTMVKNGRYWSLAHCTIKQHQHDGQVTFSCHYTDAGELIATPVQIARATS